MKWIRTEDELPEFDKYARTLRRIIATFQNQDGSREIVMGTFDKFMFERSTVFTHIIAWMYAPEPFDPDAEKQR